MKKRLVTLLIALLSLLLHAPILAEARKEVSPQEASTYPFHLTQALIARIESGQTVRGTGTYLGKGAFLTAAHNLTDEQGQLRSGQTVETYNAQGKKVFHTGTSATPYHLAPSYSGYEDLKNDLALIQVDSSLGLPTDKQELKLAIYHQPQKLLGKTVSTMGFSSLTRQPYTQAAGKIIRVEADGTLTADLGLVQENSGSPVFLDGQIMGIITAVTEECRGQSICYQATITPLTQDLKKQVLDKLGLEVRIVN
ncbi:S1C family serine protease [Streptococcus sp. NLN76]|uniref:trypsin-like serine peptidase n=1 Tax=Streptococcus sp. NLN76 TaxID=2822800 RepID=UPI0018A8B597|nr:S1C family serine protease [Streptococcus sp. NLN76]MBF8969938.1 serine protease [Streptococcus sp. NLN76]